MEGIINMDINPDNNKDTFQGRGVKIVELQEQVLFLTKERIEVSNKLELIQNKLKEFLKTIEKSPREVTFDKEVLTLYVNGMLKE
jgi:hypothetical protein